MAQFDVYPNPDAKSRERIPYVAALQCDLLGTFDNVVVAPLRIQNTDIAIPVLRLNPVVIIDGRKHYLRPQEMAAIPARLLKTPVANLSAQRDEILASLDLLFTGL